MLCCAVIQYTLLSHVVTETSMKMYDHSYSMIRFYENKCFREISRKYSVLKSIQSKAEETQEMILENSGEARDLRR